MSTPNNMFRYLTFRFVRMAMFVLAVLAIFTLIVSYLSDGQETIVPVTTQAMQFPENEEMLQDVTMQLQQDGAALSDVAPAAGSEQKP